MDVFVYGTLTDRERVGNVLSGREWSFVDDAVVQGLHRVEGRYPTLAPGGSSEGRLLRTDAIELLDAYEGVDRGLYVRVPVPRADHDGGGVSNGEGSVAVYAGDPDRLDPVESIAWPGKGDLEARVREYVRANDVVVTTRSEDAKSR